MVGDWAWGEQSQFIFDNDHNIQKEMRDRFPNGRKTATRSVDWMLAHYKAFAKVVTKKKIVACLTFGARQDAQTCAAFIHRMSLQSLPVADRYLKL